MLEDGTVDAGLPPIVGRWLEAGPDRAPDGLLEATLRPIPMLRRRGAWRIRVGRLTTRAPAMAALGLVVTVAVFGGLMARLLPPGPGALPSATPDQGGFVLELAGGQVGRWVSWTGAPLMTCLTPADGPWRILYAGGDPFVSVDLVVADGAATIAGSGRVAAEIEVSSGPYVRFDPAQLRGGDPVGRSTAEVSVITTETAATIEVRATTPDRTLGVDGPPVLVDLTVYCPN